MKKSTSKAALLLACLVSLAIGVGALTGCSKQADQPKQDPQAQEADGSQEGSHPGDADGQEGEGQGEGQGSGPSDAGAPVPDGNSISTDFYTVYFPSDMTATVDESYDSSVEPTMGCESIIMKDDDPFFYVGVFSADWGPQGDFSCIEVGQTKDDRGNPVSVWIYAGMDTLTQSELEQYAGNVEVS